MPPTAAPTETPLPTDTPVPSPTIVRTPPALPSPFTTSILNPMDYPHTYIENACEYLKNKWDPNNSTPGTVVMVIMFHSIIKADGDIPANGIGLGQFRTMLDTLHEQGFQAITMEQLTAFLETNAKIPARSVVLVADDRHFGQYFDNFFRPTYQEYGWPVVNAWISHPEQTAAGLWDENEALAAEGWVDYQAHGVIHYPIVDSTDDEYIMNELQGSISFIQEHYNKTPVAFIWPGGNFTQRSVQLARYVGYHIGFTVNPRGPIMFNWVPLADQEDPQRPSYLPEGAMNDPLMVLPRYWPSQVMSEIDNVRFIGKEAAAYAEENKTIELEYYDIVCAPALGPIPDQNP
ncbi:MAG TPA: polysaccharide deacetylase family protein [Anaerolineales bacterium]|nr:polysaccharide deacetylase family protein [Anaerolineales bacterium]